MGFGRQSGPPASSSQVRELLGLLKEAGYADFRATPRPMGFTQRQAGGRFTRDEARRAHRPARRPQSEAPPPSLRRPSWPFPDKMMRADIPSEKLAADLKRRGWTVTAA